MVMFFSPVLFHPNSLALNSPTSMIDIFSNAN